jgi:hypothetical protein
VGLNQESFGELLYPDVVRYIEPSVSPLRSLPETCLIGLLYNLGELKNLHLSFNESCYTILTPKTPTASGQLDELHWSKRL